MKIGFDAKRLYSNFTGLGNYSRTIVKNIYDFQPENDYHLYSPQLAENELTKFFSEHSEIASHTTKSNLKSHWRSFGITKDLKKEKLDIFHGLSNELPFNIKQSGTKSIVSIHDLIFKILPDTYPFIDRKIYDLKFYKACKNADKIIAISENTKKDIVKLYDINPKKIEVIYQSCSPLFYNDSFDIPSSKILKKYNLPSDFILFVGSVESRKNLKLLVEAYKYLDPKNTLPIVVVGGKRKSSKEFLETVTKNNLQDKIHWVQNLHNNYDLKSIYQKASVLVYPSFYEGFGLPVAEALLCKTPVITSNTSSLPEAGGPSSLYVNPNKPEQLANAITKIISDNSLASKMIEDGYEYAINTFSPKRVSQQLINCYKNAIENN